MSVRVCRAVAEDDAELHAARHPHDARVRAARSGERERADRNPAFEGVALEPVPGAGRSPGRTWPQTVVRRPRRDTCASGSLKAWNDGLSTPSGSSRPVCQPSAPGSSRIRNWISTSTYGVCRARSAARET